ncbi:MAG: hypothetical protein ABI305_06820 [Tepidiformaceae bacterium]
MFSSYTRAALSAVAVVAAISACSSTDTKSADAPASTTASSLTGSATSAIPPASIETTDAAPVTTEPDESEASQDQQVPPGTATAPCDNASEELFERAIIGSEIEQRVVRPVDFIEYHCAGDYALAQTSSHNDTTQSSGVLFRYDKAAGWTAIELGSAIPCSERFGVPPEIITQLPGCY